MKKLVLFFSLGMVSFNGEAQEKKLSGVNWWGVTAEVAAAVTLASLVVNTAELAIEGAISQKQWEIIKKLHKAYLALPFDWEKSCKDITDEWANGNYRLFFQAMYEVGVSVAFVGLVLFACGINWAGHRLVPVGDKFLHWAKRRKIMDDDGLPKEWEMTTYSDNSSNKVKPDGAPKTEEKVVEQPGSGLRHVESTERGDSGSEDGRSHDGGDNAEGGQGGVSFRGDVKV